MLNEWSDKVEGGARRRPFVLLKEFFLGVFATLIGLALLAGFASWLF